MWSLIVLHRHALNDSRRVTDGYWVECEVGTPAGGVDRLCEGLEGNR